ncbi:AI-2E family transporter [Mangrovimicrobium sediminis]|uniref:AI-2E family transporter n=1 Tax=Mangrovimicrobium sediminis TaxID=2562682 RepID=A0A4Z0LVD7_9GAMM|nr:AI-2E family transporter [Haliea sp. SAOS-164]TGD71167.1 AI-2E family transporter [Haliea sp. SAOS-164]
MAEIIPGQGGAPEPPPDITRWPLALVVLALLILGLYLLQPILMPFVLGGLLAYLGDPLVDRLERARINRGLGVVLVFLLFVLIIVLGFLVALPLLLQQLDSLVSRVPAIYEWLTTSVLPWLQNRLQIPVNRLPEVDWSDQIATHWQSVGKLTAGVLKQVTGSGMGLVLGLANLALVPVVAFYLMRDWDLMMNRALHMLPRAWQERTAGITAEADEVVGAFLRGQFLVMCALSVIYSVGLWMVGVQFALLLGLLAGLASIVPYLGFVVGIVASCIAAYVQFQEWGALIWVGLVFGVGQAAESMVLTPILVGDRIGLHPVAVIFALMAGGQIAGFVGVLLALPVAAVVMVFVRHAVQHYQSTDLYGGD